MSIERYDPGIHELNSTAIDHWNRYLFARRWLRGSSVIDIGCGTGYGTEILCDTPGIDVVLGVDRSYEALFGAVSRKRSKKVEFIHSYDATFVPLTGHWNTVISLEVWEHLKCPRTAAFCARNGMPASGRLIVSLPIDELPGQNEHHLHCFTADSARLLISEFFEITHEYHQTSNITFVAHPRSTPVVRGHTTVLALLQVYGAKNGAYRSAIQEIAELVRAGMHVVVLCDDPQLVRESTRAEAFFLPLESSFRGEESVSPLHVTAACAFAQWFDVKAIYAAHEFMPLARALADLTVIPNVIHLRGLPSAGWYEGSSSPNETLPRSSRCRLVANSGSTADQYASVLGCNPEEIPIIPPRIDFGALNSHNGGAVWPELERIRQLGPMMLFVAGTRNSVKGFEAFLAMVEEVEVSHPTEFTFGIVGDEGSWSDDKIIRRLSRVGLGPHRIFIAKATEEIGGFYRGASLCVIPSERSESFCRVAAEALGMGVPVVGYRGGHLNSFERYGAVLVDRGNVRGLSEAAVSMARRVGFQPAIALQKEYGIDRPSKLPRVIGRTVDLKETEADRELIVAVASDGLSGIATSDWVERISRLASHGVNLLAVLATSNNEVAKKFREAARQCGRPRFKAAVVFRGNDEKFSFAREANRAVDYGLSVMPHARGILCANDDTWPTHIAMSGVLSWLDKDGLIGGVCSEGAGGAQNVTGFFRGPLNWKNRILTSIHRISAFWLYVSRDVWIGLDGFDEGFEGYGCEDTDLSLRAWHSNKPILIDRTCYVEHQVASSYSRAHDFDTLRDDAIRKFTEKHAMKFEQYHVPLRLSDF
jgi:glycosyltransferase involved in cell wall biosynthesis